MAVPSYIGGDTQTNAAAQSLTMTIPAPTQTDDFMIAFMKQSENTGEQLWDDDGGGGNGWTLLTQNRTTGGRDQETAIYYKFATSNSESDPTFTWNVGGTNEPMTGILLVYRGVDQISPFQYAWAWAQNDCNPPNPDVLINYENTRVVCFHAATHDDISSVGAPTGFTLREYQYGGSAGHGADHRDSFSADIEIDTTGTYSPPDWTHGASNTTPEYQCYTFALNEEQPIHITGGTATETFLWGAENLTITGDGFESTQGTGKVEYWSDTSGTIKTAVTIDSWSDTSIQIDPVRGSLGDDTTIYLVVTNDNGDESAPIAVLVGLVPYRDAIQALNPDHLWTFDGNKTDIGITGPQRDFGLNQVGAPTANVAAGICEDATYCLHLESITDRTETADSDNMNVTISSKERTVMMWIQFGGVQQSLSSIWKEGGGVQNLAFLMGMGNKLVFQLADTAGSRDNVQSFSDFKLTPDRPYLGVLRYTHNETPKEMVGFVDAIENAVQDGNPMTLGIFDSHSGDNTIGDPDTNLEMGTTDVAFDGQLDCKINFMATWSDNSTGGGARDKVTEIRDVMFRRGAPPKYTIDEDTEANMQSDLDTQLADTEIPDWPLGIRIEKVSSGSDLELTADNITFNERVTAHLEWRGIGELTWINTNGSNLDSSKCFATGGGTIVVENPATLTVEGLINGCEIRIYDDETPDGGFHDTELSGEETLSGTSYNYSHSGVTNTVKIQMIADGYEEILVPVVLGSSDQTVSLIPTIELNT